MLEKFFQRSLRCSKPSEPDINSLLKRSLLSSVIFSMKSDHRDRNYLFTLGGNDYLDQRVNIIDAVNVSNETRFPNHPDKKNKENCFAQSKPISCRKFSYVTLKCFKNSPTCQWIEENWDLRIE